MPRVFRRRTAEETPSPPRPPSPVEAFHNSDYLRHNQRRQEHLASLGLPLAGRSVLELGAGIGDHSSFFLDRGCDMTISEARGENVEILRDRFPDQEVLAIDVENPAPGLSRSWDVVYAYGLLYHVSEPAKAIDFMARSCDSLLLVETCVSPGEGVELNPISERAEDPSQAITGTGCRPTRPWVMEQLRGHFAHAYTTATQPWHPEFPLDWSSPSENGVNTRAVFVASRDPLDNPRLTETIPLVQRHH
jgi:SAM-dependent methyltransferase